MKNRFGRSYFIDEVNGVRDVNAELRIRIDRNVDPYKLHGYKIYLKTSKRFFIPAQIRSLLIMESNTAVKPAT